MLAVDCRRALAEVPQCISQTASRLLLGLPHPPFWQVCIWQYGASADKVIELHLPRPLEYVHVRFGRDTCTFTCERQQLQGTLINMCNLYY